MKKLIFCDKTHSRWLILLIDFLVITMAFTLSFLLANTLQYQALFTFNFLIFLASYSGLALGIFVLMPIHKGIIRYSTLEDVFRIFKAVLVLNASFIVFSKLIIYPLMGVGLLGFNMVVVINFFIATSTLIILRISVKNLFAYIIDLKNNDKEKVLIYGTDRNSILIKQAFEFSIEKKHEIVGFIDDDSDKLNKLLELKKVYPTKSIALLKYKYCIDKLVITENHLNGESKKTLIENCVKLGIKVITVPQSTQWINGKLSLNQMRDLNIEDLLQREPIKLNKDNVFKEIKGKRVLVTGAAGSIGSEIVRQLIHYQPESIILCDQAETSLHELQLEIENYYDGAPTKIFMANVQNQNRIRSLFNKYKPQVVYHAAAFKHVPMMENNPTEAILTNVLGTKNLADISLEFRVEKFIMVSTDKAVNPTNIMGASKRLAEMYIQSLNCHQARELSIEEIFNIPNRSETYTKFITTRFGNVLGSSGSVVPRFRQQIEKGGPITVTHPDITRYFMTIPEAVQLVLEASAMGKGGEVYIFDMGKPIRIVDMAINMIRLAGLEPEKDIKIVYSGLRPGEKLYEELLNKEESVIPTYHPKIKISRVANCHYYYIKNAIDELLLLNEKEDCIDMVRKMKEIVPEFKSNNSVFKKLDDLVMS